jgi:hypothetical protein
MPLLYYRILFFCLIPVGIVILVWGIKLLQRSFNGTILLELPFSAGSGSFSVARSGVHSIWIKGPLFKRNPIDRMHPRIISEATNQEVPLATSLLAPRSNSFSTGRIEFYTFSAEVGTYRLELVAGSGISGLQRLLAKAFPSGPLDLSKYFIQIRESQSALIPLLAIPVIIAGGGGIIGGLVMGLLADQLIPNGNGGTPTAAIQRIEVVTHGGELGYYSSCAITPDSVFHQLRVGIDGADSMSVARPAGAGEWKMLIQNIDLAEFRSAPDGQSRQPVDGTDTDITITSNGEVVSRKNAVGSATWNGIDIWSRRSCSE